MNEVPSMLDRARARISPELVEAWRRDGAVCVRQLLSPQELQEHLPLAQLLQESGDHQALGGQVEQPILALKEPAETHVDPREPAVRPPSIAPPERPPEPRQGRSSASRALDSQPLPPRMVQS